MFELMVELFFVSSVQRADTTHKRGSLTFLDRATQGRRQSVGRIVVGGPIPLGCGNLNISVKLQPSVTRVSRLTSCAQPARPRGPRGLAKGCCLRALSFPALSPLESLWAPAGGDSPPVGDRHDCVFIHNPKNIDQTFLVALVPALLQGTQVDEAGGATTSWSTRL
jgi:hypothetical protein